MGQSPRPAHSITARVAFLFWFSIFPALAAWMGWDDAAHHGYSVGNAYGEAVAMGILAAVAPVALLVFALIAFAIGTVTNTKEQTISGLVLGAAASIFVYPGAGALYRVIDWLRFGG